MSTSDYTPIVTTDMYGKACSFSTVHPHDPQTYEGTIIAVGADSEIARNYVDIEAYNAACLQSTTGSNAMQIPIPSDITQLHFFIIKTVNTTNDAEIIAFAEEWVDTNGVQPLYKEKVLRFELRFDSTYAIQPQDIIDALKPLGVTAIDRTYTLTNATNSN